MLQIHLQVKTTIAQQAMGQAIDFKMDATGMHAYKITNTTDENTTLNHQMNRIMFSFDGMGQKMDFDSGNEKDISGQYGNPFQELLEKKFDIIIDSAGTTLMANPEKVTLGSPDNRLALITRLLRDITDLVQPPQKGKASFFRILPGYETGAGDTWTHNYETESGKSDDTYRIESVNDSVIQVSFAGKSITKTRAEMMGSETTTTLNHQSTGRILLDRHTGILREKNITTDSNGTTEGPFGTIPVHSRSTTTITVKAAEE